jgi:CheY-like chemotaxis protein
MIASPPIILLVEDNEDDVFFMQRVLQVSGTKNPLQVATNGQQAINYLAGAGEFADRQRFPLPFLIFLDLKMPQVNGFDVLTWMRERPELNWIVVIVMSDSSEAIDQKRAYALGARSYQIKPPTPESMRGIFDSLKSYWLSRGDTPVVTDPTR